MKTNLITLLKKTGVVAIAAALVFNLGLMTPRVVNAETTDDIYTTTLSEDKLSSTIVISPEEKEGYVFTDITCDDANIEATDVKNMFVAYANGTYNFTINYTAVEPEASSSTEPTVEATEEATPVASEEVAPITTEEVTPEAVETETTEEIVPTEQSEEPEAIETVEPIADETAFGLFTQVNAEETTTTETVSVEVSGIEEVALMPMSNEYTVTYDLGDGYLSATGANTVSYSFDAGNTLMLTEIGYPTGYISGFTTSGTLTNNNAAFLGYFDDNGNAVGNNFVPTSDITLHAYWMRDNDGDGVIDGTIKTYILKTYDGSAFDQVPVAKPTKDLTDPEYESARKTNVTVNPDNSIQIDVSGYALIDGITGILHTRQWFGASSINSEAIRNNPVFGDELRVFADYMKAVIECDKSLSSSVDALPTSYNAIAIDHWTNNGNHMTSQQVFDNNPTNKQETYIAVNSNLVSVTYNLGTDGTFASNGSNSLTVNLTTANDTYVNNGYTLGTPNKTAGAFSSTGDINSSNGFVLYWEDSAGNLVGPYDTVTTSTALNAIWAKDEDGDGYIDGIVQYYLLETDVNNGFTAYPTLLNSYTTRTSYADGNGDVAFEVTSKYYLASGVLTESKLNQFMNMLSLREHQTYANSMKTYVQVLVDAMKAEKKLSDAIAAVPTTRTRTTGYVFDNWDVNGNAYNTTSVMNVVATSTTQLYTSIYAEPARCNVTFDLGTNGTFTATGNSTMVGNAYCGGDLNSFGYTLNVRPTNTAPYSTSGDITSANSAFVYWVDENNQVLRGNTVVTDDMVVKAFWISDEDGDGVADGLVQNYTLNTNANGEFTSAPVVKQIPITVRQGFGSQDGATVTTTSDANGHDQYDIEMNGLVLVGARATDLADFLRFSPLLTNAAYEETLSIFAQYIVNAINCEKNLGKAIDTLPVSNGIDATQIYEQWTANSSTGLTDANILAQLPTANNETFTAVYNPAVVTPTPTPATGRSCQDDGYPAGYYWNGTACVIDTTPVVNPPVAVNPPAVVNPPVVNPVVDNQPDATPEVIIDEETPTVTIEPSIDVNQPEYGQEDADHPEYGAGDNSWALINLLASLVTVIFGVLILAMKHKKEEALLDENGNEVIDINGNEVTIDYKRNSFLRVITPIISVISVVFFILTENLTNPMGMVDKWTLIMVAIALLAAITCTLGMKWKEDNQEEQAQ